MPLPAITHLEDRATLYLSFAQAFRPPLAAESHYTMSELLVADLIDLEQRPDDPLYQQLSTALATLGDQPTLLQLYSSLFLAPPVRVHLNTSIYFDRDLGGHHLLQLEERYARHRLAPASQLHDLPDHLTLQLEFLAWLLAQSAEAQRLEDLERATFTYREAQELLQQTISHWLPPLLATLHQEEEALHAPPLYHTLAQLLHLAVAADTPPPSEQPALPPLETLHCHRCQAPFQDQRLQQVLALLQAQGEATETIPLCPHCRAAEAAQLAQRPMHFPPREGAHG